MGYAITSAGDVNGDGFCDLAIASPLNDNNVDGIVRAGDVWIVPGCPDGLGSTCSPLEFTTIRGNQTDAIFGCAVASADVNGDGFSDILAGAMGYDYGQVNEGRVFLYYGNNSRGLPRCISQWQTDHSAPIGLYGASRVGTTFGLAAYGRTPKGRGKVRLEWEVKPFGTPFDGTGIQIGQIYDSGPPDPDTGSRVLVNEFAYGLTGESNYHWRARIASVNPYFPRSPWFSPPGASELDVRTGDPATGLDDSASQVTNMQLDSYPNPFHTQTTVRYALPAAAEVQITVHDLQGRLVRKLVEVHKDAGIHHVIWDGRDDNGKKIASGVYWATVRSEGEEKSLKILLTE
jgi:hypothetical protein